MTKNTSKQFYVSLGLSFIFLANVFLFIPFDIYLANNEEFITPFNDVLQWLAVPALILLVFLSTIAMLLNDKQLHCYIVILAVLSLLVWLQSDILLWEYGLLNGEIVDWTKGTWRGWVDLTIWFLTISLSCLYYKKIYKNILQFVIAIFLIQSFMTIYHAVASWEELSSQTNNNNSALHELYKFSSNHNIVHLLLDGYQSDIFEELINNEEVGDIIRTELDGFVFYKETLGVFPYTRFALPALLSGKIYDNSISKDDFIHSVFSNKTILNTAYQQGYEVDIASEEYWAPRYAVGQHNNSLIIPKLGLNSTNDFIWDNSAKIFDLTLFKAAPHFIKRLIYNQQSWLIQPLVSDPRTPFFYFAHTEFMQKVKKNMKIARDAPVYKYIHVMNTHNPMVLTSDCKFAGHAIATTKLTLTVQSICTLNSVIGIFSKMKSLGIYDDALIIIHADHGGWVETKGFKKQKLANGVDLNPFVMSLATPLLAIKKPKSTGKLSVSSALVSLADIPDSISDIMDWDADFNHESVLNINSGELRTRSYYYYGWQRDAWETEYTGPIQEYTFEGSHFNTDWKLGRVFYPPDKESK